jgi:uncharacterized damage-inducible protein DinB
VKAHLNRTFSKRSVSANDRASILRAALEPQDSFDYAPPGAAPYKQELVRIRKELLEKFDNSIAQCRAASDEQLLAQWSLLAGGKPVFTMPRAAVLRGMILNHIIHRRAQLGLYLRLLDVPVPGMYGPSADEQ